MLSSAPTTRRTLLPLAVSVPRTMMNRRFLYTPATSSTAGATASSASFKNREQGEEAFYTQKHEREQLQKYKEKIQARKKEIERLESHVESLQEKLKK